MIKYIAMVCSAFVLVACGGGSDDSNETRPPPVIVDPGPNVAPIAHAGASQNVSVGTTVTLDGSASSDANGDALTYAWSLTSKPEGSDAQLSSTDSVRPTFIADLAGVYVFTLLVNDGQLDSQPATVTITAFIANVAPTAHAGASQNVSVGTSVSLDGSASSDANGNALTYSWTLTSRPEGSNAQLSSSTGVAPSFTADLEGSYVFTLIVNDGLLDSSPATVTVTASNANVAPVAHAGPAQNVSIGSVVTLDGSASSDANGDALTYSWSITSQPEGSQVQLSATDEVGPSFTADVAGIYVFSLIVNDGQLDSEPATVTITATIANATPVAHAGEAQNVAVGALVTLDGSGSSDADGDALTYLWNITSRPAGSNAQLSSTTAVGPNFTADVEGSYVLTLIVNDGQIDSEPATVTVTAIARSLNLYQVGGLFNQDTLLTLPYTTSANINASASCVGNACPNTYEIQAFRLIASGASYTISNLRAENLTPGSTVNVLFDGLSNGQVITSGSPVAFTLRSGFTRGATVNLRYSFTIEETGQTFSYSVGLQTN